MIRHIHSARDLIIPVIDFFYPPFKKLMDIQTFRYAACGGGNAVLGLVVYTVAYKFIFKEQNLHFGFYAFKPHVAALFLTFIVNFVVGFFLNKYVVFSNSSLRGRVQLFRYFAVYIFNLLLNYILLKIFVERLHMNALISQYITTAIIILFSYFLQRKFTFKSEEQPVEVKG
ncbi:MAG: GtrA family protein [Chitinophagaceae bacterium]